ncbi:hypothetical protein GY45DRAFT_1371381 [Cubamyces sp. BRFM 1775]|nr:hypothetical protein GY45DRAFT_1371381 [Cubamyces sp. BRFM 1775]
MYVDHDETSDEKDITMQAILTSILHGGPATKRRRTDHGDERLAQLDLEGLRDNQTSAGILLDMQDQQRYFDGRAAGTSDGGSAGPRVDFQEAIHQAKSSTQGWSANLSQLKIDKKAGDGALVSMTQNVATRLDVKSRKHDIPEALFRQMTTCQTAVNETLAAATPAQKAAKAVKMVGYLGKTHEKAEVSVRAAHQEGVGPARVKVERVKPVLDAVDKALEYWRTKNPKGPR